MSEMPAEGKRLYHQLADELIDRFMDFHESHASQADIIAVSTTAAMDFFARVTSVLIRRNPLPVREIMKKELLETLSEAITEYLQMLDDMAIARSAKDNPC